MNLSNFYTNSEYTLQMNSHSSIKQPDKVPRAKSGINYFVLLLLLLFLYFFYYHKQRIEYILSQGRIVRYTGTSIIETVREWCFHNKKKISEALNRKQPEPHQVLYVTLV